MFVHVRKKNIYIYIYIQALVTGLWLFTPSILLLLTCDASSLGHFQQICLWRWRGVIKARSGTFLGAFWLAVWAGRSWACLCVLDRDAGRIRHGLCVIAVSCSCGREASGGLCCVKWADVTGRWGWWWRLGDDSVTLSCVSELEGVECSLDEDAWQDSVLWG